VGAGLRLVAQGDLDVPLLASGEGAELVDFFHKDLARSVANLRAAYGAIDEVSAPFPSDRNRIAAAGVLLAIATLQLQHTDTLLWVDPLSQAAERLDAADLTDLSPEEADGLRALRMELRARRAVLAGDVEEARRELREAQPASILEERGLAVRLVALSAESMRRQPATFLEDTLQKLDELDRELSQSGAQVGVTTARRAREQLEELLLLEQRRQAGAFSIKPPTTAR
jgi:D-ribose pyranose/furanose isomerase RbsD